MTGVYLGCGLAMCNDRERHIRYVGLCSLISVLPFGPAMEIETDQYLDIKIGQYAHIDCQ
jgi:hypothetical protein